MAVRKPHQKYYLASGQEVPGVTTLLGVLAKPALVPWANKLGLQGIEVRKYVDHLAEIGTLAHHLLECHLAHTTPATTDYSPEQLDKAENSLLSYFAWAQGHELQPRILEGQFVSEAHRYGGTIDCYGLLDGLPTLLDFKTAKAIYPEHLYQVAAYAELLREAGHEVAQVLILQIGREESEGYSVRHLVDTTKHFALFEHCLSIYRLQQELHTKKEKH